jgi:ABC-2 type transport system ATP-binding protein
VSVTVRNLTRHFGETKAVDDISFTIGNGEIVGFLGPNGAGKTTTVRLITGFLSPTSGTIEVNGLKVKENPYEVRRMIGYLAEENPLYPDVDVVEYLTFIARLQGVEKSHIKRRVDTVTEIFGLESVQHLDIGRLSKGYRQRVGLAQALIQDPPLLIFDEPTNGLDPNQIIEFRKFIGNLAKDKTVIISTHHLPQAQEICNRVIIIDKGKIIANGPIADLQREHQGRDTFLVEIEIPNGSAATSVESALKSLDNVEGIVPIPDMEKNGTIAKFYIVSRKDLDVRRQIFRLCVEHQWILLDIHRQYVRIEGIFHQLTGGDAQR